MWPVGFCPFTNLKMYSTAKKRPKSVQNFAKYSIYLQKYSQILPMWRNFAKPGHTWLSEQSFAPDEAKINFFFFFWKQILKTWLTSSSGGVSRVVSSRWRRLRRRYPSDPNNLNVCVSFLFIRQGQIKIYSFTFVSIGAAPLKVCSIVWKNTIFPS